MRTTGPPAARRRVPLASVAAPTGPEQVLRVGGLAEVRRVPADAATPLVAGDGVVGTMVTGSWLLGPGGRASVGALGPLVDDVLGYGVELVAGRWSVSTELAVSMVGALPVDGSLLRAESWVDGVVGDDGIAHAEVRDAAGGLVAVAQSRNRFGPEPLDGTVRDRVVTRPVLPGAGTLGGPDTLAGLLEGIDLGPGRLRAVVDERSANPLGNLHGGISTWWSEVLAAATLPAPATTTSVRIHHVRGVPVGTTVTFSATPEHTGRTLGLVHVVSRDECDRICTVASVASR